jgi:hypothetical protein
MGDSMSNASNTACTYDKHRRPALESVKRDRTAAWLAATAGAGEPVLRRSVLHDSVPVCTRVIRAQADDATGGDFQKVRSTGIFISRNPLAKVKAYVPSRTFAYTRNDVLVVYFILHTRTHTYFYNCTRAIRRCTTIDNVNITGTSNKISLFLIETFLSKNFAVIRTPIRLPGAAALTVKKSIEMRTSNTLRLHNTVCQRKHIEWKKKQVSCEWCTSGWLKFNKMRFQSVYSVVPFVTTRTDRCITATTMRIVSRAHVGLRVTCIIWSRKTLARQRNEEEAASW